jgi:hypothetical protein
MDYDPAAPYSRARRDEFEWKERPMNTMICFPARPDRWHGSH